MRALAGGITTALVLAGPVSVAGLAGTAAAHDRSGGDHASWSGWVGSVSVDDIDCGDLEASRDALDTAREEALSTKRAYKRVARGSVAKLARAQRSAERRQARRQLRQARRELGQLRRSYAIGSRTLARHGDWGDREDWSGWSSWDDDRDDDDRDEFTWGDREDDWSGDWSDRWDGLGSVDTSGLSEELKRALAALQAARDALAALSAGDRETLRSIISDLRAERDSMREDWQDARSAWKELREKFAECLSDGENGDDDGTTDGDDSVIDVPDQPADPTPLPDDEGTQDPNGDTVL